MHQKQTRPESGVRPICSRCPHGRAMTGPCTFHSALCRLHYYSWQLDLNSSGGDEIEGLKAVSWQWGGDFWLYQILEFCGLQAMFPLATVSCGYLFPIRCCAQLGDFGSGPSPEAHGGKQESHWGKQETHEDNQRWKQGFPVGSQGEISWRNYEMLRAVVVDHFSWGTEGEMFCFASGEGLSVSWCQMATGTPIHNHTTHYTPWFSNADGRRRSCRGGKTLDGGNPLFALTACSQRPATGLRFLRRQPWMYWRGQGCPDEQRERRYMQWPLRYELLGRKGAQGVPPRLLGQNFPSVMALRLALCVQISCSLFGSKAGCPRQIGQRIWPQFWRHPTFPLWMSAILFFAPKAGEARRKEASRKGTNGRKERRKEGSQEGRKELKEGAKEASKSRGKEERCFIGKHCIHQVPSSSIKFPTALLLVQVQFLQPTFRCPEWGMWKGLKMDTITRIDVASYTDHVQSSPGGCTRGVFVRRRFSWFMCCFVLLCFVSFLRSFVWFFVSLALLFKNGWFRIAQVSRPHCLHSPNLEDGTLPKRFLRGFLGFPFTVDFLCRVTVTQQHHDGGADLFAHFHQIDGNEESAT